MAAAFAYIGMLLLSLVVAMVAALQLADFFNATEEFIVVIVVIMIFAFAAMAVFSIVSAVARRGRTINAIAFALALLALALVSLPLALESIADRSTHPFRPGSGSLTITLELLVPVLIIVLVQWGLVRRRWHRVHGSDDLSLWPWMTTVLAGLVILNPYGLLVLATAFGKPTGDLQWQFMALLTVGGSLGLLVMAGIEYYIRDNMMQRRGSIIDPALLRNGDRGG
jgi:hypothetical protein